MKKQKLAFILALGTLFSSCSTNQPGISLKECLGHDMNQSDYYVSYDMSKYHSFRLFLFMANRILFKNDKEWRRNWF